MTRPSDNWDKGVGRSGSGEPSGSRHSDRAASVSTADAASIPNAARALLSKVLDYYEGREPYAFYRLRSDEERLNAADDAWQEIASEIRGLLAQPKHGTAPLCLERLAYYVGVLRAIGDSGLSPGFGRVTDEDENSFTISLTIFNSAVERMQREKPEMLAEAQVIEAQRAETAKTGSVEDESAVGNADAPKGGQQ